MLNPMRDKNRRQEPGKEGTTSVTTALPRSWKVEECEKKKEGTIVTGTALVGISAAFSPTITLCVVAYDIIRYTSYLVYMLKKHSRTSAVSSTNFGSLFIFASCVYIVRLQHYQYLQYETPFCGGPAQHRYVLLISINNTNAYIPGTETGPSTPGIL